MRHHARTNQTSKHAATGLRSSCSVVLGKCEMINSYVLANHQARHTPSPNRTLLELRGSSGKLHQFLPTFKSVWIKNSFESNYIFGQKFWWTQLFCNQSFFWIKGFFNQSFLEREIFFWPRMDQTKNLFWTQICLDPNVLNPKFFGPKIVLVPNFLWIQIFFGSKILSIKFLFYLCFFGTNIFWT